MTEPQGSLVVCPRCSGVAEYWSGNDRSAHAGWYCATYGCPMWQKAVKIDE